MKKKFLIISPVSDFGGREVEVNIIIGALSNEYDVKLLSTVYITQNSSALLGSVNVKWTSIDKKIYQNSILFKVLASVSKLFNKGSKSSYAYVNNKWAKKINLQKHYLATLNNEIKDVDTVIFCGQLSSDFVDETITICKRLNKKLYFRTTGTIRKLSNDRLPLLKNVNLFIHNSKSNANCLNAQIQLPYIAVDQCSLNENKLLQLEINTSKKLRYGYLGRLSPEKGVIPLTKFFSKTNYPFTIAGTGPEKEEILKIINKSPNSNYIGRIESNKIDSFFEKIDVLVIPSYEEAGPLVAIEAIASGKIVVSTKVGAMEERFYNSTNNFWFEISNLQTLTAVINKVENLHKNQILSIMHENRNLYKTQFSLDKIQEEYLEAIKL